MVESNPGAEESKQTFAESVNVPLMASLNLSKVLLDPQIGEAFTTKFRVQEEHLYSTGLWGDNKIKTLADLQLEMDDEEALIDGEARDDLSDDDEVAERY